MFRKRWLIGISSALVAAMLLGFLGWHRLLAFAKGKIHGVVTKQLSQAFKRDVTIGDITQQMGGTFVLSDLAVAGRPTEPPLLKTARAFVGIDTRDLLFHRKVTVRFIELQQPKIATRPSAKAAEKTDLLAAIDRLAELGLQEVKVSDGEVSIESATLGGAPLPMQIHGLNFDALLNETHTAIRLQAKELWSAEHKVTGLQVAAKRAGANVTLSNARADFLGNPVTASGSYALDTQRSDLQVSGRFAMERILAAASKDLAWQPQGVAQANLKIRSGAGGWEDLAGNVSIDDGKLKSSRPFGPQRGEALSGVSAKALLHATPSDFALTDISLRQGTTELKGWLHVNAAPTSLASTKERKKGIPYTFDGTFTTSDWKRLTQLAHGVKLPIQSGRLSLKFTTNDTLPRVADHIRGSFTLTDARVVTAQTSKSSRPFGPLIVKSATGLFARHADLLELSGIRAQLSDVSASGSATISGLGGGSPRFKLSANWNGSNVGAFARTFAHSKSEMTSGAFAIHTDASGSVASGATNVTGTARLSDVRLTPRRAETHLSSLTSAFRQTSNGFVFNNLHVSAPEFTGNGNATVDNNSAFSASGVLAVSDLSGLKRLNPSLANLRKGSGRMTFKANGRLDAPDRAVITGVVQANNGEWGLEGGAYGLNRLDFQQAKGRFAMNAGKVNVSDLVVTGNEFNLTGAGGMGESGGLNGAGSARVMRSLALRVVDATSSRLMKEIEKLPLEYLPMKVNLSGTVKSPRIRWAVEEKALEQLALKVALKNTRVQREIWKLLGKSAPTTVEVPPSVDKDKVPGPDTSDDRRRALNKVIDRALDELLKKKK